MSRAGDLDYFLRALGRAVRGAAPPGGPEAALAGRIFEALETPGALPAAGPKPRRPGPAEALEEAFALAAQGPEPVQQVAGALRALDPRLAWGPRPGSEGDPAFRKAHANAVAAGADGLERRGDVRIGISLVASAHRLCDAQPPAGGALLRAGARRLVARGPGLAGAAGGRPPAQPAPCPACHARRRNAAPRCLVPLDGGRLTPARRRAQAMTAARNPG